MFNIPMDSKKNRKKPPECPADFVVDVPKVILNVRQRVQYDCVQMIGAVSVICVNCARCLIGNKFEIQTV